MYLLYISHPDNHIEQLTLSIHNCGIISRMYTRVDQTLFDFTNSYCTLPRLKTQKVTFTLHLPYVTMNLIFLKKYYDIVDIVIMVAS